MAQYVLTPANNPFYFGSSSLIETTNDSTAVYGAAGTAWNVTNDGEILAENINTHQGVSLRGAGSSLTNTANGTITLSGEHGAAVNIGASGTVSNAGELRAYGSYVTGVTGVAGGGLVSVTNSGEILAQTSSGSHASGVDLKGGGSVTNETSGYVTVSGSYVSGVEVYDAGSVTNYGGIVANTNSSGHASAVNLVNGGALINESGGSLYTYGTHVSTVYLAAGGTATNYGEITSRTSTNGHAAAVNLQGGGEFINELKSLIHITGDYIVGVEADNVGATIENYSTIYAEGGNAVGIDTNAASTVTNSGSITVKSGPDEEGGSGVDLTAGGSFTNNSGGSVAVYGEKLAALYLNGASAKNYGSLSALSYSGGDVSGVDIRGNAATFTNESKGTVSATRGDGISAYADATVSNSGAITATGYIGVYFADGGSLTNAGSITGAKAAIEFSGADSNTLTLQTGSQITGDVLGSTTAGATNALVLQGTGAASNSFDDFTTLDVQAGASWSLTGTAAIGAASIEGSLTAGDYITTAFTLNNGSTLDLTGATSDAVAFNGQATLQVTDDFTGAISGFGSGDTADVTNLNDGVILTQVVSGPDTIVTLAGTVDGALVTDKLSFVGTSFGVFTAMPDSGSGTDVQVPCFARGTHIETLRGAIAVEHLQIGDLVVTASGASRPIVWLGHRAVDCRRHANPKLVHPVRVTAHAFADNQPQRDLWLSPGHSVAFAGVLIQIGSLINGHSVEQIAVETVEYWHIELDAHDVLLAESLPAESYLDTGNRADFTNGDRFLTAHPDFMAKHWRETCLPLVLDGPEITQAKQRLLDRLPQQGVETTRDADAHIIADGRRIAPTWLREDRLAFIVPRDAQSIVLKSRTFTPAHSEPASRDLRHLGLCVGGMSVDGEVCALESESFRQSGWSHAEYEDGRFARRWSDGAARLSPGARVVIVDLAAHGHYFRGEGRHNRETLSA